MKTIIFTVAFLLASSLTYAGQKNIKINTQSAWGGGTSGPCNDEQIGRKCGERCKEMSDDMNPNEYLQLGCKIVSSRHIVSDEKPFCGDLGYCRCSGTEYIIDCP